MIQSELLEARLPGRAQQLAMDKPQLVLVHKLVEVPFVQALTTVFML